MSEDQFDRLLDPDVWTNVRAVGTALVQRGPEPGDLVAYRYSAWRVRDVRKFDGGLYEVELEHHVGPRLDGVDTVVVPSGRKWIWLYERFQACSCHGHPWPCLDYDRDVLTRTLAARARWQLAGAEPGVCASCRTPITERQKTITFPEASLIVPGAPGPTFHAMKNDCWRAAKEYETKLRLPAHPEATRLASCPGAGFIHEIGLEFECTAGPGCTGLHGPFRRTKYSRGSCGTRTYDLTKPGGLDTYERPLTDCGYRGRATACLGAETGPHKECELKGILF